MAEACTWPRCLCDAYCGALRGRVPLPAGPLTQHEVLDLCNRAMLLLSRVSGRADNLTIYTAFRLGEAVGAVHTARTHLQRDIEAASDAPPAGLSEKHGRLQP